MEREFNYAAIADRFASLFDLEIVSFKNMTAQYAVKFPKPLLQPKENTNAT